MMKKFTTLVVLVLVTLSAFAQEKKEDEKSIQLYGFIRNAIYTDTYRGVDAVADQFYLLPKYIGTDANGDHLNQDFQSNMTAIATRIGTKISGPELFGAKSSALIEFDFGGVTNVYPSVFRIRHAYMKLNWEKTMLIAGQTWHPFWGDASFPHVGNLNTGAPFQPFNRSPLVRLDYNLNENINVSGSFIYENQYTSKGFYATPTDIAKTKAMRFSAMPELVVMAKYKKGNFNMGLGASYKSILPTDIINNPSDSLNYKTGNTNTSLGFTAYGNYKKDKLYVLLKGTYGQNLTHLIMPGGYGVKSIDANGEYEYTNYNNYAALLNITYGKKWQAGLLAGYGANLGTSDPLAKFTYDDKGNIVAGPKTAGLFTTLKSMSRIAPSMTLNVKNLRLTAEYEMTNAEYSDKTTDFDYSNGLNKGSVDVTNHRMLLMMMYFF